NWISGGLMGIGQFQDDGVTLGGISSISYNAISDVTLCGIYLDGSALENFLIVDNTLDSTGGNGVNFRPVKSLTFANNVVTGTYSDYPAILRKPAGMYLERNNLWYPVTGNAIQWQGVGQTFAAYKSASGQGANDLTVNPQLASGLTLSLSSP